MEYFEIAEKMVALCSNDLIGFSSYDEYTLSNALYEIKQNNPEEYEVFEKYLSDMVSNMTNAKERVCTDLINLLDNECETFDPICDGSVEHAEGMAKASDLIEDYKNNKIERRFLERE